MDLPMVDPEFARWGWGKHVWGKNQLFAKTLTEKCMKMKEIGPRSANHYIVFSFTGSYIIYNPPYHDYITGSYDNTTGILATIGDHNAFNDVGNVNVSDKSIIGALLGGRILFTLTYQG